jgi:GNAT superfamily N-acetyltransferase
VVKTVFDSFGFTWDPEDYCADLYHLQKYYLDQDFPFWVAETDGQIVGTIALTTQPSTPKYDSNLTEIDGELKVPGCDATIERLYVLPSYQSKGLGTKLLKTAVQEAKNRNCQAIELWSDKRLTTAHQLYEKFGAVVVGDRICDDPDESPEWGFYLKI